MLTFIIVIAIFVAIGWGLQTYTDITGRMKSKDDPRDNDDPTSF